MSSISPIRPRDFTIGMVIALLVGFFVAFIASLWVNYHHGAIRLDAYGATEAPNWSLDRAEEYIRSPQAFPRDLYAMGIGAAVAALFLYLRTHYLWWSIGPIGLAMAPSWAMDHMYFSIFMGWLCRVILLFLGGLRLYRSALPYFLGLLLGEGLFSGIAVLWGLATGINAPPFFPAS